MKLSLIYNDSPRDTWCYVPKDVLKVSLGHCCIECGNQVPAEPIMFRAIGAADLYACPDCAATIDPTLFEVRKLYRMWIETGDHEGDLT